MSSWPKPKSLKHLTSNEPAPASQAGVFLEKWNHFPCREFSLFRVRKVRQCHLTRLQSIAA